MEKKYKRIGILGGTFDPVHLGHVIVAEEARIKFDLELVLFIPSGVPPHKNQRKITSSAHRLNMLQTATKGNPNFMVSRIEVDRAGYSFTVDTLIQLRKNYGEDAKILFIIGADVVNDLLTWKNYSQVFSLCEFIAVLRQGYKSEEFLNRIQYLNASHQAMIHVLEIPLIEISSTCIREGIKNGEAVKHLLDGEVEKYITDNKLYLK